ncbi:hypothetical protein [Chryseolinea sp. H1M3-3]|uniref:hypothetical protein n=1 Tax=Chryseolinea sp. H1M3-3 TaxID=3034144 RepID=UPI0023ECD490|nr:hypothetical protein [Chryseolinea sp. H1M3-3]
MEIGNRLLILTEAGEGIGYGHYSRCLALKQYFDQREIPTEIFLYAKGDETVYSDASVRNWILELGDINEPKIYSHVLLDSYLIPLNYIGTLKSRFDKVIALDDYHRIDIGPDLIINPNIFGNKVKYNVTAVGGRDFVILRNSFRQGNFKIKIKEEIQNILLTLGGSDTKGLIPILSKILLRFSKSKVKIVAGSDRYAMELGSQFESQRDRLNFFGFVSDEEMKQLMLGADVAISACGQTLHELASLGVPTIGICVGDDQILNMKEYLTLGFLNDEIYWNSSNFDAFIINNLNYLGPAKARNSKSLLGKSLFNDQGLNNIYNAIFK